MKVKVCGMRDPENIREVLALGVDLVGFIFYNKSKRFVGKTELSEWISANENLFGETKKVGVFVNAELDYILNVVHDYKLDYVQLHGDESPGYCRELKLLWSVSTLRKARLIKAFPITPDFNFQDTNAYADSCPLFIFDTGGHTEKGGTGAKWDWSKLNEYNGLVPFLLSGGIGPEDAEQIKALDHVQMLGVDLNSGFEESPGLKNPTLLRYFLKTVKYT
ncbi:phosphoribosylanthranilate isomerase [Neolewinella aurantiaca]|uniref:N-(5'-phosphoribosyl)anthranilate isomerase n=1 Tax=Neolewinella aurantiaca TaxID=2602767 RepID=A0A5C7G1F4_9BACT|nr:phosphoribosylanthranilate isomerase [Neolewinella aurantiaca]TXF91712.1 phosphoribosylanthranilate isomerase [Neolewinella aurantiaca]